MDIPWGAGQAAIEALPDFAAGAIGEARKFVCGLGRNYEDYFVGIPSIDPLGAARRSLVDKICGDSPQSPPGGLPPNSGDSCACVEYDVRHNIKQGANEATNLNIRVTGPVFGLAKRVSPAGDGAAMVLSYGQCVNGQLVGVSEVNLIAGPLNVEAKVTGITRVGGAGGSCPVPRLPGAPANPSPPPPERQREYVPIPIPGGPTVIVPIVLVRPTLNVNPQIDFEVNVGPFNVNFNLGGIRIDLAPGLPSPDPGTGVPLPPIPDYPRPPALPPATPGVECPDPCPAIDLQPVINRLDGLKDLAEDIKDCACKPEVRERFQQLGSATGGTFTLPDRTFLVRLELVEIPESAKVEFGRNDAPNVYYAGWASVGRSGYSAERLPISYKFNEYPVGEGQNEFSFTARSGYNAVVSAIYTEDIEG